MLSELLTTMPASAEREIRAQRPRFHVAVDNITELEWNDILSSFADANIYQSWAYGAVHWQQEQLSHFVLKLGDEVLAAAQLRIMKVPLLKSGVAYLRWGPLWRRTASTASCSFEDITQALRAEYVVKRRLVLRVSPACFVQDPHSNSFAAAWKQAGWRHIPEPAYRSLRLDLTHSLDQLRKDFHQKWRNLLNAAEKGGLEVIIGTQGRLFQRFLAAYDQMQNRKHFDTFVRPSDFDRMQERLPLDQKLLILLAEKKGVVMAGAVAATLGDTGIYLLGATSDAGLKSKGAHLLQWRLIEHLKKLGKRYYDLGGVNPERNPGVYHFKAGLGGEEVRQLPPLELAGNSFVTRSLSLGLALAAAVRQRHAAVWRRVYAH